jgi:hypothetical protein
MEMEDHRDRRIHEKDILGVYGGVEDLGITLLYISMVHGGFHDARGNVDKHQFRSVDLISAVSNSLLI